MIKEEKWTPNKEELSKEELSKEEYEFYIRTIELFEKVGLKY